MKNSEKAVRVSRWNGPGIVKPIEAWNKMERAREDMSIVNKKEMNKKEERGTNTFKKWNLPDQPEGYIRSKKHDFL